MVHSDNFLRNWQQVGVQKYFSRFETKKAELSAVYQGCGKTLYSAACFVSSAINDDSIASYKIKDIKASFLLNHNRNSFVVIFIPNNAIISSTLKAWSRLGVNLLKLNNSKILKTSPQRLLNEGVHGIIVTYHQCTNNNFKSRQEWTENQLIGFIKRSPNIAITGILDECHNLTIEERKKHKNLNLSANFFVNNAQFFKKLHLLSGTPVKSVKTERHLYIPFVAYTENGEVVPDFLYDERDAITDGVIVNTKILQHSLSSETKVKIEDREVSLSDSDLSWYTENYHRFTRKRGVDKSIVTKAEDIKTAFSVITNSTGLWSQLLVYGDDWLNQVRQVHTPSKGLIFAPAAETAIKVHREILSERSVLCIGKDSKYKRLIEDCNFVTSDKIHDYMKANGDTVDWIITCEALKEGFDFPDCKVSILLPRIEFLNCIKISQMMGRTNRMIESCSHLQAIVITLNFKPVIELIEANQSGVGLCKPDETYREIIELYGQDAVRRKKDKVLEFLGIKEASPIQDIKILNLVLDNAAKIVGDAELNHTYSRQRHQQIKEINIRTHWVNWCDVVLGNSDAQQTKEYPPQEPGIYYMINAKTQEYLYVGSSDKLLRRISDRDRFMSASWIKIEGYQNIYIGWLVCDDYLQKEKSMKAAVNPKYDNESPPVLRLVSGNN